MQRDSTKKRLLLVGPTNGSVHVRNYYFLVRDYFDDVLVVTIQPVDFCKYEIADFSMKNPFTIRKKIKRIRKIIHDYKPDIIHVHQANTCAYLTIRANDLKIPLVLTCWGSDVLLVPQMGFVYRYIVKYVLRRASALTACSYNMSETIAEIGEMKPVVVANFGIDFSNDLVITEKENIIYSNRLHHDIYFIDKIIQGFAEFQKKHPGWKLIIGAKGDNTESLKALASNILPDDSYEFIGFVNATENQRQYLRAKVWVSIPSSDGTSISLYEAMGYGCVPVVSDIAGNKECITDKENGIIVRESVGDAIEEALKLSPEKVQSVNRKIVLSRATKEVNRKLFCEIYDSLLNC